MRPVSLAFPCDLLDIHVRMQHKVSHESIDFRRALETGEPEFYLPQNQHLQNCIKTRDLNHL